MLPSETMIWQPEFTDKTLSRKPGAVQPVSRRNKNVATVALNNKNARVLWVLLTNDKEISPEEVMGAAYM
ncbi:TPA: hypothetical protein NPY76_002137 [Escherichia coli]|nr:hypothetical protein [Escherichia coli]